MSMPQSAAHTAEAFQLAAALEVYEQEIDALVHSPRDLELYQRVSRHIESMRLHSAGLPGVSVAWVEVLIGHFELTHCLWRMLGGSDEAPLLDDVRLRHLENVRRLRRKCLHLVTEAQLPRGA